MFVFSGRLRNSDSDIYPVVGSLELPSCRIPRSLPYTAIVLRHPRELSLTHDFANGVLVSSRLSISYCHPFLPFFEVILLLFHPFIFSISIANILFLACTAGMPSTHHTNVFFVNNHIFSSPNTGTIPPIPSIFSIDKNNPHPRDTMTIRWADPCYPGLPFIPLSPRFDSEPFRCLSPPRGVFPIEGSGFSWRLKPATVKSFQALENDLLLVEKALRTWDATLKLPSWWSLFRLPHKYGYNLTHTTYEGAQTSVVKSRDAFLPLMGWCSFLISHFHERLPPPEHHIFCWEKILLQSKFSFDYIQVIKASELTRFSADYPRVGVFLNHYDNHFQHYVRQYIKCSVPVWIHWGDVALGRPDHRGVLNQHLPSDVEVAAARKVNQARVANETRQAATPSTMDVDDQVVQRVGPSDPTSEAPEPERNSRQKRGEHWHEFFARMDKRRVAVIEQESLQAKKTRMAREKAQQAHPAPGLNSKAPTVFEWEEDQKTGFLLRKIITRSYAQDIWHDYTKSQRRYDSTLHEWDLCTALDPKISKVVAGNFYDDSDSDDESYIPMKGASASEPPVSLVARDSIISTTYRSPSAIQPRLSPPARCGELPSFPLQVVHDHISSATSHESMPHPSVILPPKSASQNDETMSSEWEIEDATDDDGIPVSNRDEITSSSGLLPQTIPTDRDRISSATALFPTIPLPTATAETDANISFSIEPPPLAAILAPHDHITSKAPTYELAPVPPTISPPKERNEGAAASAQNSEGRTDRAEDDDTAVSAEPGGMHAFIYSGLPTPLSSWPFRGTLLDQIYEHYGFIGTHGDANTSQPTIPWLQVRKIFGDLESHVEKSLEGPISHFLEGLLHAPTDPLDHLASVWDLATHSTSPLIDSRFRLIARPASTSNPDAIYFIEAKNASNDVNWQLILRDAATVLRCFRQEKATSMRDIALFLLRHGAPFSTCIQRSQVRSLSPPPSMPLIVLGWRPAKHKPTVSEYNFYENLRRAFFDHPRSRAARLKGGIISRLALEGGGELVDEHVLEGPSDEVLVCGTCISGSRKTPESLWDDDLSEADMNLLCGVYKVYTGKSGQSIAPCHSHRPF
jgi:hypothetical protein